MVEITQRTGRRSPLLGLEALAHPCPSACLQRARSAGLLALLAGSGSGDGDVSRDDGALLLLLLLLLCAGTAGILYKKRITSGVQAQKTK